MTNLKSNIIFNYRSERPGTTCPESKGNNEIWLDNGNTDKPGVFDNHCLEGKYDSTTRLLTKNIDKIQQTMETIDEQCICITFVTHVNPDLDAISSIFLLQEYITHGENYFIEMYAAANAKRSKFIDFVDTIDSGKGKTLQKGKLTLYALIYWLNEIIPNPEKQTWEIIENGISFIRCALNEIDKDSSFDLFNTSLNISSDNQIVNNIKERSDETFNVYEEDLNSKRLLKDQQVRIFTKDGKTEVVNTFIWREPPSIENEYILARMEGAVVTFVPYIYNENKGVRVSINMDILNADTFTLKPLVEIYEQIEQIRESQIKENGNGFRRDYSSRREADNSESRFKGVPFCNTTDPWFFNEGGDMVDSPGIGTLLTWEEMAKILICHAELIYDMQTCVYTKNTIDEPIIEKIISNSPNADNNTSLLSWKNKCKEILKRNEEQDNCFVQIVTVVNPVMISHSDDVLEAYFADITDSSYIDRMDDISSVHLDHKTHFYCTRKCGMLFVAKDCDGYISPICQNLIELDESNNLMLKNSRLIDIIGTVVRQREELTEISKFLSSFNEKKDKEIKAKQSELIKLNARIQQEDTWNSQTSQEIYNCLKCRFSIEEMRTRVTETMDSVSEYIKESVYGIFDYLSAITIPFIIISTLFQMGFIQIPALLSFTENFKIIWWIVVFAVTVVAIFYLLHRNKRK